ncbi:MAG: DNA-binding protein [Ruminococcaceae bacterium]|nr:DNA-binding protein [Oscillospiraceae bacterium]
MSEKLFMTAADISELLGVSKTSAYAIIRKLNEELMAQGYIVLRGKVNSQYFYEKTCYNYNK